MSEPALPPIEISIRHGNLAYARHPVVVGHYEGYAVVSAEAVLDRHLRGALTRTLTKYAQDSGIAKKEKIDFTGDDARVVVTFGLQPI